MYKRQKLENTKGTMTILIMFIKIVPKGPIQVLAKPAPSAPSSKPAIIPRAKPMRILVDKFTINNPLNDKKMLCNHYSRALSKSPIVYSIISVYTIYFKSHAVVEYIQDFVPRVCSQKKNIPCCITRDIYCLFILRIARIELPPKLREYQRNRQ